MSLSSKVKIFPLEGISMGKPLVMRIKEISILEVIQRLQKKQMSQTEAEIIPPIENTASQKPAQSCIEFWKQRNRSQCNVVARTINIYQKKSKDER